MFPPAGQRQQHNLQEHHLEPEHLLWCHHSPGSNLHWLLLHSHSARNQDCGLQNQRQVCAGCWGLFYFWCDISCELVCETKKLKWVYLCGLQLCGHKNEIWSLELHSNHEGLHRCRPDTSCGFKHWCAAEPEDLGGAGDRWARWGLGRCGNWLLLGNQPGIIQQHSEIRPDPGRVRRALSWQLLTAASWDSLINVISDHWFSVCD